MEPSHRPIPNTMVLLSEPTIPSPAASQENLGLGDIRVRLPYITPHVDVVLSKRVIDQFVEEKNAISPDDNGSFDITTHSLKTETQAASIFPELTSFVELGSFSTIIAARINAVAPSPLITSRVKMSIKEASDLLKDNLQLETPSVTEGSSIAFQQSFVRYASLHNLTDAEICNELNISAEVLGEIRGNLPQNPDPDWDEPVETYCYRKP